jgi:hypothetical protein
MVVDFLRHCYGSTWHLFRDNLSVTTAGFYYFSAPDAKCFPGYHNVWSRDWLDRNHPHIQGLGEDLTHPHFFRTGQFAGDRPADRFVGSLPCIEDGELVSEAIDEELLFHGYPLDCWLTIEPEQPPPPPKPRDYERIGAFDRCAIARLWARIIEWSYVDAEDQITTTIDDFCEQAHTVTWIAAAGDNPAITIVDGGNWAAVAIDGTRDFQQLAMQALRSQNGPTNIGIFATNVFWYNAATYVHTKLLAAGVSDRRPIFFTGHSYGAAVATILCARYRFVDRARDIRYLLFGCPKIGDQRLSDLLALCDGISLRNHNDLVTAVPPDLETLWPAAQIFPISLDWLYENWKRPPHSITQDEDGELVAGGDFELSTLTVIDLVRRVILNQPFTRVIGHGIDEYYRRILLRCPDEQWPIDEQVDIDLETEVGLGLVAMAGLAAPGGMIGLGGVAPALNELLAMWETEGRVHEYHTPGSYTWTAPAGVFWAAAFVYGAGGDGGLGDDDPGGGAGGGGGGAMARGFVDVTPGGSYAVQVGGSVAGDSFFQGNNAPSELLLEDGTDLLLEDGTNILLEAGSPATITGGGGGDGEDTSAGRAGGAAGVGSFTAGVRLALTHPGGAGGDGSDDGGSGVGGGGGGGSAGGYYDDGNDGEDCVGPGPSLGGDAVPDGGEGSFGADVSTAGPYAGGFPGGGGGGNADDQFYAAPGGAGQVFVIWLGPSDVPPASVVLLEDNTDLLLEDGTNMLME